MSTFVMLGRSAASEMTNAAAARSTGRLWISTREIEVVHDPDHWNGKIVTIERLGACRVVATERRGHDAPWRPGEAIDLMVDLVAQPDGS